MFGCRWSVTVVGIKVDFFFTISIKPLQSVHKNFVPRQIKISFLTTVSFSGSQWLTKLKKWTKKVYAHKEPPMHANLLSSLYSAQPIIRINFWWKDNTNYVPGAIRSIRLVYLTWYEIRVCLLPPPISRSSVEFFCTLYWPISTNPHRVEISG